MKILVVEDDLTLQNALTEAFEQENYEVITASNGKQALEDLVTKEPSIIVLDILMPVMGGLEFLSELRKRKIRKDLPVIILTNVEPDTELLQAISETPPAYYLIKSNSSLDDIVGKVNSVMKRHNL